MGYQIVLKVHHIGAEECAKVLYELEEALRKTRVSGKISVSPNGRDVSEEGKEEVLADQAEKFVFFKGAGKS